MPYQKSTATNGLTFYSDDVNRRYSFDKSACDLAGAFVEFEDDSLSLFTIAQSDDVQGEVAPFAWEWVRVSVTTWAPYYGVSMWDDPDGSKGRNGVWLPLGYFYAMAEVREVIRHIAGLNGCQFI